MKKSSVISIKDIALITEDEDFISNGDQYIMTNTLEGIKMINLKNIKQHEINKINDSLQSLDSEIKNLKRTINNLGVVGDTEDISNAAEAQISINKSNIESLISDVEAFQEKYTTLNSLASSLDKTVGSDHTEISSMKKSIDSINAQLSSLVSQDTSINDLISSLSASLETTNDDVETIESSLSSILADISIIKISNEANVKSISDNKDHISSIGTDITNINKKISSLEKSVSDQSTNIGKNETAISTQSGKITTLETNVESLTTNIGTLETSITKNTKGINDANTEITSVKKSVSSIESDVSSLKTDNDTNKSNISTLQSDVTSNKGKITAVEASIDETAMTLMEQEKRISSTEIYETMLIKKVGVITDSVSVPDNKIWVQTSTGTLSGYEKNSSSFFEITSAATIDLRNKDITKMIFGKNTNLNKLIVYGNKIEYLDLSNCTDIKYVHIHDNPICESVPYLSEMIESLPDRNGKAFGSIIVSNQEKRRIVEPDAIKKDWYFGSTIMYDSTELAKCDYYIKNSGVLDIWESAEYGEGTAIGLMDVGFSQDLKCIDYTDAEFFEVEGNGNFGPSKVYSGSNGFYHGNCAMTIAAGNGNFMYGLAPKAHIIGTKMNRDDGGFGDEEVTACMDFICEKSKKYDFVGFELSNTYAGYPDKYDEIYPRIDAIFRDNSLKCQPARFCCAAGNTGSSSVTKYTSDVFSLGELKYSISVGAVTSANTEIGYTTPRRGIDLAFYGKSCKFEQNPGVSGTMSGTSMATQLMAAASCLAYRLLYKKLNRIPTNMEFYDFLIRRTIKNTNTNYRYKLGNGVLNFMSYNDAPFRSEKICETGWEER